MDHPVSINIFDQIQTLCRDYRRQLRAGHAKAIEELLQQIDESARLVLFQNLLHIDIEFRRQQGDLPQSSDYTERFPHFSRLIRQAFFEDTMMSMDPLQDTPAEDSIDFAEPLNREASFDSLAHQQAAYAPMEMPAARRIGDYELIRELGRGGMGVVYEAKHLQRQNPVALKTLPTGVDGQEVNAERLHRFRNEFRSLSEINHPNLVGMQTLEVDGGQWFFTMDLIDGTDFLSYVRPDGKLDEQRIYHVFPQLVRAIIALHRQQFVHCDLKPSNVLVDQNGTVKVLDFGLIAELHSQQDHAGSTQATHFAGTPRYAAPEQFTGQRSQASDRYSAGVMLFEALTGNPPFSGSKQEIREKKCGQDPPSISDRVDLPTDLSQLADGLLATDPTKRPDEKAICSLLSLSIEDTPFDSPDSNLDLMSGSELILIGREEQLARLNASMNRFIEQREPAVVWVTGLSGEGKSSLVDEFLRPHRSGSSVMIFSGRCYDRESVPFKALDGVIESLTRYLMSLSAEEVASLIPDDTALLAQLFPVLQRVDAVAAFPGLRQILDPEKLRHRALFAMRELFSRLASITPVLLFIDDLQWGDADSATTICELLKQKSNFPLMLLGSYRTDESVNSLFLNTWEKWVSNNEPKWLDDKVQVTPLTAEQCLEVAARRVGRNPIELQDQAGGLFGDCGGNPYFLDQLIEGFDSRTESFRSVPLKDAIRKRMGRLPAEAREILNTIAASGSAIDVEEASRAAGHAQSALTLRTHMRNEKLVRFIGDSASPGVDTFHDKIRETLLQDLTGSERRTLPLKLAETIESSNGLSARQQLTDYDPITNVTPPASPRVFDLAYHFNAADDHRAFAYQMRAGIEANRTRSLSESQDHLHRAESIAPDDLDASTRYRLMYELGTSYTRSRNNETARDYLLKAHPFTSSALDRARVHVGLGMVHHQTCELRKAIEEFDVGLRQIGSKLARSTFSQFRRLLVDTIKLLVHRKNDRRDDPTSKAAAEIEFNAQISLGSLLQEISTVWQLQVMVSQGISARKSGNRELIAASYNWLAGCYALVGVGFLFRIFSRRAAKLQEELQSPEIQGLSFFGAGCADYFKGKLETAEQKLSSGVELLRQSHDTNCLPLCAHFLRHTKALCSQASDEQKAGSDVLRIANSIQNKLSFAWGHYGIANALARQGKLTEASAQLKKSETGFGVEPYPCTKSGNDVIVGFALFQASQWQAASEPLDRAWRMAIQEWYMPDFFGRALCLWIECQIGPMWLDSTPNSDRIRFAGRMRQSRVIALLAPNLRPHVARLRGRALCRAGRLKRGIRMFEHSVKLARRQNLKCELARALLDLAAVKHNDQENNRIEAIKLLKNMETVIPRTESWLLGDQYDEAVVAPEFDMESWRVEYENESKRETVA